MLLKSRSTLFAYFLLITFFIQAQELVPKGVFLKDTVKIGEQVLYSLSITYPVDADVLFPDSLFNFSPFELNQKDYFFTSSNESISFDSAVYNLSTFEIDSVQFLNLPVFLLNNGDSLVLRSDLDSIVLGHVVLQIPDSLAFIENTIYREISKEFNYPYLIAGLIIFTVLFILVYLIFSLLHLTSSFLNAKQLPLLP